MEQRQVIVILVGKPEDQRMLQTAGLKERSHKLGWSPHYAGSFAHAPIRFASKENLMKEAHVSDLPYLNINVSRVTNQPFLLRSEDQTLELREVGKGMAGLGKHVIMPPNSNCKRYFCLCFNTHTPKLTCYDLFDRVGNPTKNIMQEGFGSRALERGSLTSDDGRRMAFNFLRGET